MNAPFMLLISPPMMSAPWASSMVDASPVACACCMCCKVMEGGWAHLATVAATDEASSGTSSSMSNLPMWKPVTPWATAQWQKPLNPLFVTASGTSPDSWSFWVMQGRWSPVPGYRYCIQADRTIYYWG